MTYQFKMSDFLVGCFVVFLANAAVLVGLVFVALHVQILVRFIDIAGALTGGYALSQHSDSISTWTMIRVGSVLVAQAAAIGVIGNILGWYSYCYLTARGKIQAGYISFAAPILIGLFFGSSLGLLACFAFSFVMASITHGAAEDTALQESRDYLMREFPSAKLSADPQSLRQLVSSVIPEGSVTFDSMLRKLQEQILDAHSYWVEPDYKLPNSTVLAVAAEQPVT